ncbi:expressed protein [Phakopsora pachyrhizi]|uniref:Expressed protein n=1 Tax=Phakopsora pachyrhizi TaxID=170000 RepID=A0AAV0B7M5_PHAPC|nr:expressed protein [Phakopsora pachyrhizi]
MRTFNLLGAIFRLSILVLLEISKRNTINGMHLPKDGNMGHALLQSAAKNPIPNFQNPSISLILDTVRNNELAGAEQASKDFFANIDKGEYSQRQNLNLKHKEFTLNIETENTAKIHKKKVAANQNQQIQKFQIGPPTDSRLDMITATKFFEDKPESKEEKLKMLKYIVKNKEDFGNEGSDKYSKKLLEKSYNQYKEIEEQKNKQLRLEYDPTLSSKQMNSEKKGTSSFSDEAPKKTTRKAVISELDENGNEIIEPTNEERKPEIVDQEIPSNRPHNEAARHASLSQYSYSAPIDEKNYNDETEMSINLAEFKAILRQRFNHSQRDLNQFTEWLIRNFGKIDGKPVITNDMQETKDFWFFQYIVWVKENKESQYKTFIASGFKGLGEKEQKEKLAFDFAKKIDHLEPDEYATIFGASKTGAYFFKNYVLDNFKTASTKWNKETIRPLYDDWMKQSKTTKYGLYRFWEFVKDSWGSLITKIENATSRIKVVFKKAKN